MCTPRSSCSRTSARGIGGLFAPAEAARVERAGSSYQLIPGKRGQVSLNGEGLGEPRTLKDGDRFEVRKVAFQFFHRMAES